MSNTSSVARMNPDDRRDHIVQVATDHFAKHGYDGASISKIAADAGVTRALIYHYFPGKEPLMEEVLRREADALLAATAPLPELSRQENLRRALHSYLDHFAASTGQIRELYMPHPLSPSVVWEIAAANHTVQVDRLLDVLDQPDTAALRLALRAWLAFVEEAARTASSGHPGREEIVRLCLTTLQAAIDVDLDLTVALAAPRSSTTTDHNTDRNIDTRTDTGLCTDAETRD